MLDPSKTLATNVFTTHMWNVSTQTKRNHVNKKEQFVQYFYIFL